jgi:hypothetical protein
MKVRVLAFALMLVIPSVTSAAEGELQRDKMLMLRRRNRSSHQSNISINASHLPRRLALGYTDSSIEIAAPPPFALLVSNPWACAIRQWRTAI